MYNVSKTFILPSLVEGFSSQSLEAMACYNAVIVTRKGGSEDYITGGINGYLCNIKDSE